jgi:methylglutaconyl-CoA hydratase
MKAVASPHNVLSRSALTCLAGTSGRSASRALPRRLTAQLSIRGLSSSSAQTLALQRRSFLPAATQHPAPSQRRTLSSGNSDEPHAYLSSSDADSNILTLTLNRPAQRNAISRRMLSELLHIFRDLPVSHPSARALILRSSPTPSADGKASSSAFCAGADLKERRTMSQPQVVQFLNDLRSAFTALERLPIPSIAALDGLAMGGGMELALCADLRVASEGVKGLGLTETKLGIIPG